MEKQSINGGSAYSRICSVILFSFLLCFFLLGFDYYSASTAPINRAAIVVESFTNSSTEERNFTLKTNATEENRANQEVFSNQNDSDSCEGRYIYIHDLPRRFNSDILDNCRALVKWSDVCPYVINAGLGPLVVNRRGVLSNRSWYATNQFLLEPIFHERMKKYECLTSDSSSASAIFVPFYAGLDVGRYLWGSSTTERDALAAEAADWLRGRSEWRRMWGRDHFFIGGRPAWEFRRLTEEEYDWGSKLMFLPEFMNTTMLTLETTSWSNEFAVPYPTYFHPSSDSEVSRWQSRMRQRRRRYLFAFTGAPRPGMNSSIRNEIIEQCLGVKKACKFLDCNSGGRKCDDPVEVISIFRSSVFCLQPPGDSYTRRSIFDSILAGCIPVFFHPYSFYAQYIWYLPKNYSEYSVYIQARDVKEGRVSIKNTLSRFSTEEIVALREAVVRLIPRMIYRNPSSKQQIEDDAIDVAVRKVLERVGKVRRDTERGKDPSAEFAAQNRWDLKLEGLVGEREWEKL